MHDQDFCFRSLIKSERATPFVPGGLFLDDALPSCFVAVVPRKSGPFKSLGVISRRRVNNGGVKGRGRFGNGVFLSVSLSVKGNEGDGGCLLDSAKLLGNNNGEKVEGIEVEEKEKGKVKGSGALNTTKHLWAGAVSAMVSRSLFISLFWFYYFILFYFGVDQLLHLFSYICCVFSLNDLMLQTMLLRFLILLLVAWLCVYVHLCE